MKITDMPDSFCLAPWTHKYRTTNGRRRVCCQSREYLGDSVLRKETELMGSSEHWNSSLMKSFRRRMMGGEELPECSSCHSKHKMTNSYREFFNDQFSDVLAEVLEKTNEDGETSFQPISFDYRFSNLCNYSCRMCGPIFSSKWEREIKENFSDGDELLPDDFDWAFKNNLKAADPVDFEELRSRALSGELRDIYWVGGEPLMWPEHWNLMTELVESGMSKNIDVRYNTNLSILQKDGVDLVADILPHFKSFTIGASQDGFGENAEYIRSGLEFKLWVKNLRQLCEIREPDSYDVYIDFTVTLPGVFGIKSLLELSNELEVPMMAKPVFAEDARELLSLKALPREILDPFVDRLVDELSEVAVEGRNLGVVELIKSFKSEKNFEEEFKESYKKSARIGKSWLLKLESLRTRTRTGTKAGADASEVSLDRIYRADSAIHQWWTGIYQDD